MSAARDLSLHPRNVHFSWSDVPSTNLRRVTPAQVHQFNEQGFFRLEGAFRAEELEQVMGAIEPLEREHEQRLQEKRSSSFISASDAITFTSHIASRSPVLKEFSRHPVYKDLCHDLVGPSVRLYWDQSVYKKSGKPQEFPWHQDNGYTFTEPQQYLTCWTPLCDVDVENGCPWIAPGLHKLGTLQHWSTATGYRCLDEAPDAVPVPAQAGDVIVFSSLAPHRTGPNLKAGSVRKAYILQYAPEGAIAYPADKPPAAQNDPHNQFLVLENGA